MSLLTRSQNDCFLDSGCVDRGKELSNHLHARYIYVHIVVRWICINMKYLNNGTHKAIQHNATQRNMIY